MSPKSTAKHRGQSYPTARRIALGTGLASVAVLTPAAAYAAPAAQPAAPYAPAAAADAGDPVNEPEVNVPGDTTTDPGTQPGDTTGTEPEVQVPGDTTTDPGTEPEVTVPDAGQPEQPATEQPAAPVTQPAAPVVEQPAAPVTQPAAPVVEQPAAPAVQAPAVQQPIPAAVAPSPANQVRPAAASAPQTPVESGVTASVSASDLPAQSARSVAHDAAQQTPAQVSLPAQVASADHDTVVPPTADHGQGAASGSTGSTQNRTINAGDAGILPASTSAGSEDTATWLGLGGVALGGAVGLLLAGLRPFRRHTATRPTD